jgi:hypothetical protein
MNWTNLTVNQFIELNELKREDFESDLEFNIVQLSIITNRSYEEIEDIPFNEFADYYLNNTKFLSTKIPIKNNKVIKVHDITLYKVNFNHLSVAEFIDLDNYTTDNYIGNLKLLLAIIYRQMIPSSNPLLYTSKIEEYGDWIYVRSNLFNDLPLVDIWGVIDEWLNYRSILFEKYDGLFDGGVPPEDDANEDLSMLSGDEKTAYLEGKKRDEKIKKWGWEIMVLRLADMSVVNMDKVYDLNMLTCLNSLSMKKELGLG